MAKTLFFKITKVIQLDLSYESQVINMKLIDISISFSEKKLFASGKFLNDFLLIKIKIINNSFCHLNMKYLYCFF